MKKETKIIVGVGSAVAVVGTLVLVGKALAKPKPTWEPAAPEAATALRKRFFNSYELHPGQPQEIWVYEVRSWVIRGESRNPVTDVFTSVGETNYNGAALNPALVRPSFDYIMSLTELTDGVAIQLAQLVMLFGFKV